MPKRVIHPTAGSGERLPCFSRAQRQFIWICAALVYGPCALAAQPSPPLPIIRVLADADTDQVPDLLDRRVVVEGIVTSEPIFRSASAAISTVQDSTGGIRLFTREPNRLVGRVSRGDRVRVAGVVTQYYGAEQIVLDSIVRLGAGTVPTPRHVFAADLQGERLSGLLVHVSGQLILASNSRSRRGGTPEWILRDRSGRIRIRIPDSLLADPDFVRQALESKRAEVIGIADQSTRREDPQGGYRVVPRDAQDIQLIAPPPYRLFSAAALVLALGLTVLWLWIRRRHAESRVQATSALNARLVRSQETLRQIIDALPHHVFVKDEQGRILIANAALARSYGRTVKELEGKYDTSVAPVRAEAEHGALDDLEVIRTGFPNVTPARVVTAASGDRRLVEVIRLPFRTSESDEVGVLCIGRDVTEERERAVQLRRAERLASVGTLVSGVAHELNNPLSAVKGLTQLMLMDPHSEDDVEMLETIHREADRMARIVADLQRLSRQTQDTEDAPCTLVDLNEAVHHVLRLRSYSIQTHNVSVVEDLQPDLAPVAADRGRIEQVILNLVVNAEQAIGATGKAGTITIRTRLERQGVCLYVEDTGPGIALENRERVFDPFWTTKAPGEGTGLGLSLVHGIVTEHGGEIRVDSEPGKGARFTVVFPRAVLRAPTQAISPREEPADTTGALRVLVVDDEASVRRTLVRYLRRRGHRVDEAEEGGAALRLIEEARSGKAYDVIVSDLRMPGVDGIQLLERLKAQDGRMDRRLIFVTGDAANPNAERLAATAGIPMLVKPFDFGRIDTLIERATSS